MGSGDVDVMDVQYCMECLSKHSGAAIKYCDEAVDYYLRSGEMDELVQGKMQSVTMELAGMADDVSPDAPDAITRLYNEFQMVRKRIDGKKLEYGGGAIDDVKGIRRKLKQLRDELFRFRHTADFEVAPAMEYIKQKVEEAGDEGGEPQPMPVEPQAIVGEDAGDKRMAQTIQALQEKAKTNGDGKNIFDRLTDHLLFGV